METFQGQVQTIMLDEKGDRIAWLHCPAKAIPAPGRYLLAWRSLDVDAPLAIPIFASAYDKAGFLAVATGPLAWEPGDILQLRGPLGRGFTIPANIHKLALGAFSGQSVRLLPLIVNALARDIAIALFLDGLLPELSAAVEVHPLGDWQDALSWADFLALELPVSMSPQASEIMGVQKGFPYVGAPGQVLLLADMPCGGLADCGVCSIGAGRNWKLICKDGPVFDLEKVFELSD